MILAVLVGVFSWQLARSNRVVPDAPSTAPILWLWSPTQPARLHRRLRRHPSAAAPGERPPRTHAPHQGRAAGGAHADRRRPGRDSRPPTGPASRLSRQQRRRQLQALTPQVIEIERLALRLAHQHRTTTRTTTIGGPYAIAPSTPRSSPTCAPASIASTRRTTSCSPSSATAGLLDPDDVLARTRPTPAPAPVHAPAPPPSLQAAHGGASASGPASSTLTLTEP